MPILPIAVYLRGGATRSNDVYRAGLLGRDVLEFRFECVSLDGLDAEAYSKRGSPIASALAALMNREGLEEPLRLRALMLETVARSMLDPARKLLLLNLIETYFVLAPADAEAFGELLARPEFREVREMQVTWADKMKEQGREEGRQEGRQEGRESGVLEGKREALLRLLHAKFGQLPVDVFERVESLDSPSELDACLDRIVSARTLEEIGLS